MTPYYADEAITLYHGDAHLVLSGLPSGSADCVVSSPPYFGLRNYGVEGQYGLEPSPVEYVETMRLVFAEVRRVLADDGTLWLNLGDSYANPSPGGAQGATSRRLGRTHTATASGGCTALPPKNLIGIPWQVAFALQDDGWTLRNAIVWHKPNAMPESVVDRFSACYEHVFLFGKAPRYWFDIDAVRQPYQPASDERRRYVVRAHQPSAYTDVSRGVLRDERAAGRDGNPLGRNPGNVWSIPTRPLSEAHFATMPPELASRCIRAGCKPGGVVLDPFSGSGTTGLAATRLGRRYVGIDLNAEYLDLSLRTQLAQGALIDGEAS